MPTDSTYESAVDLPQNLYEYASDNPTDRIDPLGLIDWSKAERIREYNVDVNGKLIRGDLYRIPIDKEHAIVVWKPKPGQNLPAEFTYWCHGLTFGGKTAKGGPYSIYATGALNQLLKVEWTKIPCKNAKKGDIAVWFNKGGEPVHSAVFSTDADPKDYRNTNMDTKNGFEPQTVSSFNDIDVFYASQPKNPATSHACYTKKKP